MPVETVQLHDGRSVKLGRRKPTKRFKGLWLHDYLPKDPAPAPASVDWTPKAMAGLNRMYLNDTYGDCVMASAYHEIALWTGNESGVAIQATDQEVYNAYESVCGPGDNGCVITDVLDHTKSVGLIAGGNPYKIADYIAVDSTKKNLLQIAINDFGTVKFGINLPNAWTTAQVWDVTNTGIVGGHDVSAVGYNAIGVLIASWGAIYTITWAALASTRWVEEAYIPLSPDWTSKANLSPSGLNVATLQADLATLGAGGVPSITPTPPPVPVPPTPTPTPVPPVPTPTPTPTPTTLPPLLQVAAVTGAIFGFGYFTQMPEAQVIANAAGYLDSLQAQQKLAGALSSIRSKRAGAKKPDGTVDPCAWLAAIQPEITIIEELAPLIGSFFPAATEIASILGEINGFGQQLCGQTPAHR